MVTAYDYSQSEFAHKAKLDMILVVFIVILLKIVLLNPLTGRLLGYDSPWL